MLLAIRDAVPPHDENDLQPFGRQHPQGLAMPVPTHALLVVIGASPGTTLQRPERQIIHDVAQGFVAGVAKLNPLLFSAAPRYRHASRLRLQVAEGTPP